MARFLDTMLWIEPCFAPTYNSGEFFMKSIFRASKIHATTGGMRGRSRRRGAALIEFGLIATIFFTMLLGMIQFGIYQSTTNTLWNLSREGARFASVSNPTDTQIKDYVTRIAPPNINNSKLTVRISPTTRVSGQPVAVNLVYDMRDKMIFPDVSGLLKKTYSTASTMRVE